MHFNHETTTAAFYHKSLCRLLHAAKLNGVPFIAAYNKLLVVTTASILTIFAVCVWSMCTLYADTIYHQVVFFIVYGSVVTNKL